MTPVPSRLKGHKPEYSCERDPEGNYWTVECECGGFEEHGSTREVVRLEHYWHRKQRVERDRHVTALRAVTKEEREEMILAHNQGFHDELPRQFCPECEGLGWR